MSDDSIRTDDLDRTATLPESPTEARLIGHYRILSAIENGLPPGEVFSVHDPDARRLLKGWNGLGLHSIEHEIAELRERRELLEEQLPNAEEVAEAEKQAAELAKQATEQSHEFNQSWSTFLVTLTEAEKAARHVVATRSQAQVTIPELSELREQYALDIDVPRDPRPDPGEEKLAGLLGSLLRDVGHAQVIDRGLDGEVASARRQVAPLFIEPGSPWENGYVESFNARLRDEFLDGEIFYTLKEVQVLTERWRWQYNHVRPHQSLGYRPPAPEARDWPLAASREDKQPAIH